jgi:hypothetical protein
MTPAGIPRYCSPALAAVTVPTQKERGTPFLLQAQSEVSGFPGMSDMCGGNSLE